MVTTWLRKRRDDGCEVPCCPECEAEADPTLTYCTVCGYDLVQQARTHTAGPPRMV